MNENETFALYKYVSNKLILPALGMLVWCFLIYQDKIKGMEEIAMVGVGILCFSQLFSLHELLKTWLEAKSKGEVKNE